MLASLTSQYVIVAAIVSIAVILLAIRASKYFLPTQGGSGCGSGCGGCANRPATPEPQLLQLGSQQRSP